MIYYILFFIAGSGDGEIGYGKAYDGMDEETKQR